MLARRGVEPDEHRLAGAKYRVIPGVRCLRGGWQALGDWPVGVAEANVQQAQQAAAWHARARGRDCTSWTVARRLARSASIRTS
eukprot:2488631-Prymnesium_polylepis.1